MDAWNTLIAETGRIRSLCDLARPGSRRVGNRQGHPLRSQPMGRLVRFLDDGRIEIDSNTVERAMRPVALTRKNALFAGSDEGEKNWAMLASLIETCKLHSVNPQAYFTDVLTKLVNNWPNSRLADLPPWTWSVQFSYHGVEWRVIGMRCARCGGGRSGTI